MKTFPILATLLLFACPVWACESFDECMAMRRSWATERAMAYKLDEISKKLEVPQACNLGIPGCTIHHGKPNAD